MEREWSPVDSLWSTIYFQSDESQDEIPSFPMMEEMAFSTGIQLDSSIQLDLYQATQREY